MPFKVRGEGRNGLVRGVVEPSRLAQSGAGTQFAGEVPGRLAGGRRNPVVAGKILQFGPCQFRGGILESGRQNVRVSPGFDAQPASSKGNSAEPRRAQESEQQQHPCRRGCDRRKGIDAGGPCCGCAHLRDWDGSGSHRGGSGEGFFLVSVGAEVAGNGAFRCIVGYHAARGCGLERDPAKTFKVEFRPCVGVPGVHLIFRERTLSDQGNRFSREAAGSVANRDAARDAFGARHDGHG
ncbi:hypothetical protein PJL18_04183 [Paenarthrobacter nicotinovorans]|nr:hypothetical protein [Paenarthrobacter nicotinovorans]